MVNPVLKVALCNRRTDRRYKNRGMTWTELKDRCRTPIRTTETVAEYPKLPKDARDALKDHGGFVGGWLREGVRKNGNVISRSLGCLDADSIPADTDFRALVRHALPGVEWFLYSTHRHAPDAPRFRLVILLDREVSEEEYPALMRQVAKDIGMDFFDDTTYQANRMMYWPSCPSDGIYVFDESQGAPLAADRYLERYPDWRATTLWPVSSRQSEVMRRAVEKQEDPLNKEGLIGAFCRTYFPIQTAMETFLSDVYAPTAMENRWDYLPADSTAGVVVYDDRFVYSHHATDPAGGRLLNAFDLVRIHRFGDADSKGSFSRMCDFAQSQDAVKTRLLEERRESVRQDFGEGTEVVGYAFDWSKRLRYRPKSKELENSTWNLMLILENDPALQGFAYNEMAGRVEVTGKLPWDRPDYARFWRDVDTSSLLIYLDRGYTVFTERNLTACFARVAEKRRFHPVRDYLLRLPPWDGEKRVEFLFSRCLGAEDTPYVRAVARKFLAAAVARIMVPGCKFDCIPVLDGRQGIGKSSLFRMLAGPAYYSETLSLTDMSDKTGAEKLQGVWIAEISELAGMKKAEIEKVKAFLSTSDDAYRPSYGKTVESHPRQAVMVATVNGDRGYLRDITGNRRFWIVKCRQEDAARHFDFTPEERDQIWAEAVCFWESGERLYLEDAYREASEKVQRESLEADDRLGMVCEYLDTLLPASWEKMDLYERRRYLEGAQDPTIPMGTETRMTVSNLEIWAECFGRDPADMKSADSYAISAIIMQVEGWEKTTERRRLPIYGQQRIYRRVCGKGAEPLHGDR